MSMEELQEEIEIVKKMTKKPLRWTGRNEKERKNMSVQTKTLGDEEKTS